MSDSDDLLQQFKSNILQSLNSPSPKVKRKRKLITCDTQMDPNDSDIESPHKKLRTSNNHITNNGNNIDEDIEFNELFDINQEEPNDNSENTNNTINTDNNYKSVRKSRRYFNTNAEDNITDPIEKMDNIRSKPKNITFKCYNCDESGHIARNCPYETIEICFKCGESGHSGFYCINNICSHCLKCHPLHECNLFTPNKIIFRFCIRCGSFDHYINQCDVLLNHRLTDLQCFVCGKYGHLNCKSKNNNNNYKVKRIQLCSNCGDDKHTYSFCKHLKMNKAEIAIGLNTQPNEPKICYNCNGPNHCSRNCPLIIRQKQQRKKINKHKFNYRSADKNNKNNKKNKFKKSIKQQNENLLKIHDF
eukprot:297439_1